MFNFKNKKITEPQIIKFILILLLIFVVLYLGYLVVKSVPLWRKGLEGFIVSGFIFGGVAIILLSILLYFVNRYSPAIKKGFLFGVLSPLILYLIFVSDLFMECHPGPCPSDYLFKFITLLLFTFIPGIFFGKFFESSPSKILTIVSSYTILLILSMPFFTKYPNIQYKAAFMIIITLLIFSFIMFVSFYGGWMVRKLWKRNLISKLIAGGIVLLIVMGGSILFYYLDKKENEQSALRRALIRVYVNMEMIQRVAELYYKDTGSYTGFNCDSNEDMIRLCDDIEKRRGIKPTIYTSESEYCAYVNLPGGAYHCVDSTLTSKTVDINPGEENYCDGQTFICPISATWLK